MEANPYAPPQANILVPPPVPGSAEQIRVEHLNTEATLKSAGFLYYLGAVITALIGSTMLVQPSVEVILTGLALAGFGVVQAFVGHGLRHFRTWSRVPTIILSMICLLAFPIGTLINGVILASVASAKGKMVLSEGYKAIIAATPHLKQKNSVLVWILLVFVLLLLTVFAVCIGVAVMP